MPGKIIAQLMGHAKVDTTLNIYAQVLDGSVREAAERLIAQAMLQHDAPPLGPSDFGNVRRIEPLYVGSRTCDIAPVARSCRH